MLPIDKLNKFARLLHLKGLVEHKIRKPKRGGRQFEPKKFRRLRADRFFVDGFACVTADAGENASPHAVFLHGGAYVAEGVLLHRKFMEKLAKEHGCRVTYVDYPLAPEHGAKETRAVLKKAYAALAEKYPRDEFALVGDSAGGGLALAFLQSLAEGGGKMPAKTVLISPWLDLSMSRPEAAEYEKKDPTLSIDGLLYAAKEYAKDLPLTDPAVSPVFGKMDDLGDILVTAGMSELFYPDCRYLKERADGARGTRLVLAAFENMFHDFVMAPIRESEAGCRLIAAFLAGKPLPREDGVHIEE